MPNKLSKTLLPDCKEATEFALDLLIPANKLRELVDDGMTSIEDLANYFGVPAMAIRQQAARHKFNGHGL